MKAYNEMSEAEIVASLNASGIGYCRYNDIAHPRNQWRTFSEETVKAVIEFFVGLQEEEAAIRRRLNQLETELKSARWDDEEYKALEVRQYEVSKLQTWHIARPAYLDIQNAGNYQQWRNAIKLAAAEKYRYTGGSVQGMARERDRLND